MNKVYTRINWENYPSEKTAVNETNLNKIDFAVDEIDKRVVEYDTTKANVASLNNLIDDWVIDETTGVITIHKVSGEQIIFDLNIEKVPVNFSMSDDGILTMETEDGTKFTANIGAMIPILTFEDSEQIAVSVNGEGVNKTYTFTIKTGSITEDKLQPNFLADVTLQANNAKLSEQNAKESENNAKESENNAKNSENNAKASEESSALSESNALKSETNAKTSESNAKESENNASESASTATSKASSARSSASTATTKASEASASATSASESEAGAKRYYEQAKQISESFSGALRPLGTVSFDNLPALSDAAEGDMYNISDQFTTTSEFKEGSGNIIPAGSNVFKTTDGFWDVLSGSPVTGVKGNSETYYRRGNVNITAANIGLGNVNNTSDSNKPISTAMQTALDAKLATSGDSKSNIVTFTSSDVADGSATAWTTVTKLASGITHATFFARVSQMFKNVRYLYKMLGTTSISTIGDGTVTGAIGSINDSLINYKNGVLNSENGFYHAIMQDDGNFVVYRNSDNASVFDSVGMKNGLLWKTADGSTLAEQYAIAYNNALTEILFVVYSNQYKVAITVIVPKLAIASTPYWFGGGIPTSVNELYQAQIQISSTGILSALFVYNGTPVSSDYGVNVYYR